VPPVAAGNRLRRHFWSIVIELFELRRAVDVAMGRCPGTLLLKNARLVNVFTLSLQHTHILLAGWLRRWASGTPKLRPSR
jgi:hypothetical protein